MNAQKTEMLATNPNLWQEILTSAHFDFSLDHLVELQSSRTPQAIAVQDEQQQLRYCELIQRSNQLAHALLQRGVKPNALVGVCMERSVDMVVALLGILKAGGAYVPFDPDYPQARLDFMAEDAAISLLVTDAKFQHKITVPALQVMITEDIEKYVKALPKTCPDIDISADNRAYMIYTSGSTGKPKGAIISHKAIINRLMWMQLEYKIGPSDTVLQKTPMSFDVSVWEFFWPLIVGAKLFMARPGGHKDPDYLVDTIIEENISILHFVPSMLSLFLSANNLKKITQLRHVFCSGEALPAELTQKFFRTLNARLHNLYGPTEAAVDVTYWECKANTKLKTIPIGKPISNIRILCLDKNLNEVAHGKEGELHIGGVGLAEGYWNRPELTAEKFISDPFSHNSHDRLYKTGDLGRIHDDGTVEYLGRIDFQVKIRGLRIELGEIESELLEHPAIQMASVSVSDNNLGEKRLLAFLVVDKNQHFSITELRSWLGEKLPDHMVPAVFILLDEIPLMPNGKVDRKALPQGPTARPDLSQNYIAPSTTLQKDLASIWRELLNLTGIGIDDNFFDLGGNSLLSMMSLVELKTRHQIDIPLVMLFQCPTIRSLAKHIERDSSAPEGQPQREQQKLFSGNSQISDVAIVGMSGRFPGAYSIDELWQNLCDGTETVTHFSKQELGPGLDPEQTNDPRYVFARGIIPDGDKFDAAFFGISPTEAKTIDPQQRVFLELAWAALENAGYCAENYNGLIGVYAGMGNNNYYPLNVMQHTDIVKMVGQFPVMVGNEKDHLATRVANKLNLTGPAVSVHTACSTAMTAIDNAYFSLITGQCDMALAGGISLQTPQFSGQLAEEGGVFAPDGHCRPFDEKAAGTMFSDSAGIVVLKRLDDAIADRDTIYATLKSTALNNDGANKISYLAPSIEGQKKVIAMALARAGVSARDISYIEAHGTGTPVGDPIEVEALTQVYRRDTEENQFCGLGSIKSNLGHPTIAAGVAGVIKVALSLKNEKIPATLHYQKPNPKIQFETSPFYVVDHLKNWPRTTKKRYGAVSAFGFGGTNGHAILEEPPEPQISGPSRPKQLILLSAKSKVALARKREELTAFLQQRPDINLADLAFTLHSGRAAFNHRQFFVCESSTELIGLLGKKQNYALMQQAAPELVFMFPGQGCQYLGMGKNLYDHEPIIRETIDNCANELQRFLGLDIRELLFPETDDSELATLKLKDTRFQQPAIFVLEYALARLWQSWGIEPNALVGHSIGEFVCAVITGVFSLQHALHIIAERGRLMSEQPEGAMLSVRLPARELQSRLRNGLSLAASNGPALSVASGPLASISALEIELKAEGIGCTLLQVSRAFHSPMMDAAAQPLRDFIAKLPTNTPSIPTVSTATGSWLTPTDFVQADYWAQQLCSPVLFREAIATLWQKPTRVLVEVGPRNVTSTLARQQIQDADVQHAFPSLGDTSENNTEWQALLTALGNLWLQGVELSTEKFWAQQQRNRIPLPCYPFERKRHWLDPIFNLYTQASEKLTSDTCIFDDIDSTEESKIENTATSFSVNQSLIAILEEISGIEFGDDLDQSLSFAELGLDSLFLTQIGFKLKKEFALEVSFRQLTDEYSSIAALTTLIETRKADTGQTPPLEQAHVTPVTTTEHSSDHSPKNTTEDANQDPQALPCSAMQQEIFTLIKQQGDQANCAFNESISIHLTQGKVDLALLKQAIHLLFERHDALNMCYTKTGKSLRHETTTSANLSFKDLSTLNAKAAEAATTQLLKDDFCQPFDLNQSPLARVLLIQKYAQHIQIVLTAHLAICDGWSLDVLVKDLGELYSALVEDRKPILPAALSFRRYLAERQAQLYTASTLQLQQYWQDKLTHYNGLYHFKPHTKPKAESAFSSGHSALMVDPITAKALRKLSSRHNCSLYVVLLAGLKLLLAAKSGREDLLVGMPVADQTLLQQEFVGNGLYYVPVLSHYNSKLRFGDWLNVLRDNVSDAVDHARYSASILPKMSTPGAGAGNKAEIQLCLNYSPQMNADNFAYSGLAAGYEVNPRHFESFDLFVNAVSAPGDHLRFEFQYNYNSLGDETLEQWQQDLLNIYQQISANPKQSLNTLLSQLGLAEPTQINSAPLLPNTSMIKPGITPCYFGRNNALYGIFQQPETVNTTGTISTLGVLFCYPIGQEYMKSHWAFRLLANALVAEGIPVFKFDYYGTGDSLGDTDDWCIDRWSSDIVEAANHFKTTANITKLAVISLRFGCVLAANAIDKGLHVDELILWNPVVTGSQYLNTIKQSNRHSINNEQCYFPFPTDEDLGVQENEIMGYCYNEKVLKQIQSAQLMNNRIENCDNVFITASTHDEQFTHLLASLKPKFNNACYHLIEEAVDWDDYQKFQDAVLPSEMIHRITELIEGEKP